MERSLDKQQNKPQPVTIKGKINVESRLLADAYDGNGRLMLRAGEKIERECEVEWLDRPDIWFGLPHEDPPTQPIQIITKNEPPKASPPRKINPLKNLNQRKEQATQQRSISTRKIASVFEQIVAKREIDAATVRAAAAPLLQEIRKDPRALLSMINMVKSDAYTFTHSVNVCILSVTLAIQMNCTDKLEDIAIGALMHDLGKVATPVDILHKAGPLTQRQMYVMKQHPKLGAALLIKAGGFSKTTIECVLDHHENLEGNGYPNGKSASQIAQHSRIVAIADVYDALTTDRPYRQAMTPKQALTMMSTKMDKALDADMLKGFVAMIGHYPVGSTVELTNGYTGVVIANSQSNPHIPAIVQLTKNAAGSEILDPLVIDLRIQKEVRIVGADPPDVKRDVTKIVNNEKPCINAVA